ncbi:MAG: DUF1893 domain-containing protein [Dehalococcoidales bacterium]|nr:DUF1893 domain-containing protein [Dehalococcoidales bacterium]
MTQPLFEEFTTSTDTLRIYAENKLVFTSNKDRLLPLLEYLDTIAPRYKDVIIMDKIMGNAAALLAVLADCREVYSPLGSEFAIQTLNAHHIKHHLGKIVPHIMKPDGSDMCPMERMSIGKSPQVFHKELKNRIKSAG